MIAKIHRSSENKIILAVCDSSLVGKKFEDNDTQLDLTSRFYAGEETQKEQLAKLFKNSDIINLVGEECVDFALKEKIIEKKNIIKIKSIPHAQVIMVREEQ